jgi:hypothetical protein
MLIFIRFGGSLTRALRDIYPEHEWPVSAVAENPRGYWNSAQNRYEFVKDLERALSIFVGHCQAYKCKILNVLKIGIMLQRMI